jgi:anaerobic magnesium-protoporphyrin IX monomethyl ester cyclase
MVHSHELYVSHPPKYVRKLTAHKELPIDSSMITGGIPLKVAIAIPRIVSHNLDPHTGIPFMPHMAAHFAGALLECGVEVQVLDSFGIDSNKVEVEEKFMFFGVSEDWIAAELDCDCKILFVYCRTIEDLISSERICSQVRKKRPEISICMFENIQTVNSFSLKEIIGDFLLKGIVDLGIMGEPERRGRQILEVLTSANLEKLHDIEGVAFLESKSSEVIFTKPEVFNVDLDLLPMPAWELFNLSGYWSCGYSHAPAKLGDRFLPILTSRGCPYRCTFCVSPAINPKWRSRSASNVVDEMAYFVEKLGVTDFHVSDLDPTISEQRTIDISNEIISRDLKIDWKIAQGTKIETIKNKSTLDLMYQSGCKFFSFSPESGSMRMLEIMNKKFDKSHALDLTRHMNKIGMRTQACFIAGVPGELKKDRKESIKYVRELVKAGVDEIAVTIFTPIPGAALGNSLAGFSHYSELSHSPAWRSDYTTINRFRYRMYLTFFLFKIVKHPRKVASEIFRLFSRNFETKMEMSIYKVFKVRLMYYSQKFRITR